MTPPKQPAIDNSAPPTKKRLSREEIAAIEVGHTDIKPAAAKVVSLVFLAIIFGIPLTQFRYEWKTTSPTPESEESPAQTTPITQRFSALSGFTIWPNTAKWRAASNWKGLTDLNSGMMQEIDRFETRLDEDSLLHKHLIPPVQWLLTGQLHAGNEKAYCGRQGWLFYRPDLDLVTGPGFLNPEMLDARSKSGEAWTTPPQPDPRQAILAFRDQLKERGIELVLMPAPVKPMIYPEKLAARFESNSKPLYNPSQAALIAELESAGVTVYDAAPLLFALKSELPKGSYLETDTHWTPTAMQRSAAQLAELINSKVNFDNPANSEWTLTPENITRHGDIFDMLKLPDSQNFYKPESATVQRVTASEGNDWRAAADAEVLLLGDSFVNIYSLDGMGWGKSAGFAEHLSAALKRPLDRISLNDNGSFATRQELATDLARGNDRLANKKVVVWEFAAREFASGDWKAIPLELRQGRTTTADKSADTASFVVNATIKSMPAPPVPGAVPYQDAVIGMQVEITGVESGAYDLEEQPEALVYAWVMRKNQLTPVARYRAGQKLKLALRPWEDVRAEVGSFNRLEPDDPMALMLEPYWAEE